MLNKFLGETSKTFCSRNWTEFNRNKETEFSSILFNTILEKMSENVIKITKY